MKLKHRNRLLWLASILERRATAIRRYVKAHTPKRKAAVEQKRIIDKGNLVSSTSVINFDRGKP